MVEQTPSTASTMALMASLSNLTILPPLLQLPWLLKGTSLLAAFLKQIFVTACGSLRLVAAAAAAAAACFFLVIFLRARDGRVRNALAQNLANKF